jgi:cytochrome c oxidase cbb3-type subunit 1
LRRVVSWDFGYWSWALLSLLAFALADHGDVSHHATGQIVALGLLLAWAPLSWGYLRSFAWPQGASLWLLGGLSWWALLLISGWFSFLPGVSERLKFTHGLVSHAHLALACYITAMNWVLLAGQGVKAPGRRGFLLWQAASVLHVGSLFVLGWLERDHERELFLGAPWVQGLLSLRLVSGLLMLGLSVAWLISASRGLKSGAGKASLGATPPTQTTA